MRATTTTALVLLFLCLVCTLPTACAAAITTPPAGVAGAHRADGVVPSADTAPVTAVPLTDAIPADTVRRDGAYDDLPRVQGYVTRPAVPADGSHAQTEYPRPYTASTLEVAPAVGLPDTSYTHWHARATSLLRATASALEALRPAASSPPPPADAAPPAVAATYAMPTAQRANEQCVVPGERRSGGTGAAVVVLYVDDATVPASPGAGIDRADAATLARRALGAACYAKNVSAVRAPSAAHLCALAQGACPAAGRVPRSGDAAESTDAPALALVVASTVRPETPLGEQVAAMVGIDPCAVAAVVVVWPGRGATTLNMAPQRLHVAIEHSVAQAYVAAVQVARRVPPFGDGAPAPECAERPVLLGVFADDPLQTLHPRESIHLVAPRAHGGGVCDTIELAYGRYNAALCATPPHSEHGAVATPHVPVAVLPDDCAAPADPLRPAAIDCPLYHTVARINDFVFDAANKNFCAARAAALPGAAAPGSDAARGAAVLPGAVHAVGTPHTAPLSAARSRVGAVNIVLALQRWMHRMLV